MVISAVALVPWTIYLGLSLPRAFVAYNCDRTRVGFDVMTAHGEDRLWSVVTAVAVELPLAAVLIGGSLQVLRLVPARLWALDQGSHSMVVIYTLLTGPWQVRIPLPSDADTAVRRRGSADSDGRNRRRHRLGHSSSA